ncbi:hypothetical protein LIER_21041 [Lithospermum erythrorhizon]|uniref:Uncharacterized protein n=1 Tax=Lithospermum erythrorhizon TaxID=34254 RepID=A0AAV3QPQ6_LITER
MSTELATTSTNTGALNNSDESDAVAPLTNTSNKPNQPINIYEEKGRVMLTALANQRELNFDKGAQLWQWGLDVSLDIIFPHTTEETQNANDFSNEVQTNLNNVQNDFENEVQNVFNNKELKVYSRRKNNTNSQDVQKSDLVIESTEPCNSKDIPPEFDLNMPIAVRKGTRITHPIEHFVSYSNLVFSFGAFTASLSNVTIPKNIDKALTIPKWKNAVLDETNALNKNET